MPSMTDACKAKLTELQKSDLRWRIYWIAGREYYRAQNDLEKMARYDEIAAKAYPDHGFGDANPQLDEYLLLLGPGIKEHLPGWNNADCSFDQTVYACFANWLASLSAEERAAQLQAMAAGTPPDGDSCDTVMVMQDPVYTSAYPPGVDAAASKRKWWPWLLGIGSVAVVGVIAFADRQEKFSSNPAGKRVAEPTEANLGLAAASFASKAYAKGERWGGGANRTTYPGKWYGKLEELFGVLNAQELTFFNDHYDYHMAQLTTGKDMAPPTTRLH